MVKTESFYKFCYSHTILLFDSNSGTAVRTAPYIILYDIIAAYEPLGLLYRLDNCFSVAVFSSIELYIRVKLIFLSLYAQLIDQHRKNNYLTYIISVIYRLTQHKILFSLNKSCIYVKATKYIRIVNIFFSQNCFFCFIRLHGMNISSMFRVKIRPYWMYRNCLHL